MISKEKSVINICVLIVLIWTCLPSSINEVLGICVSNTMFRFNVWSSLLLLLIAFLLQGHIRVVNGDRLYIFVIMISSIGAFIRVVFTPEYSFSSVIEGILVMVLPYLLTKVVLSVPSMELRWRFVEGVLLAGVFVALQVVLFGGLATIMEWSADYTEQRAFTTMGQATVTADFLFVILVLSYVMYQKTKQRRYAFTMLLTIVSILLLQTRAAILLAVVFAIYVIWSATPKKMIRYMCVGLMSIIVSYFLFPEVYEAIYIRFFTGNSSGSNRERIQLMQEGMNYFIERPILGGGIGLVLYRVSRVVRYSTDIGNTHNQWIALLAEHGLIGTSMFFVYFVNFFRKYRVGGKLNRLSKIGFLEVGLLCTMFETIITTDIRATVIFWIFPIVIDTCYKSE